MTVPVTTLTRSALSQFLPTEQAIRWAESLQSAVVVATSARQMMADLAAGVSGLVTSITALYLQYGTFDGQVVYLAGYYAIGDGGGGPFYWDAASTATDDGGLVINPTGNAGTGRWLRIVNGNVYQAAWWGVKSELGFDNTPMVQAALDALFTDPALWNFTYGPTYGYGTDGGKGAYLDFDVGRYDFLSLHPTQSDRMLWMKRPVYIRGAGRDRTVFCAAYASVKTWLVIEPNPSPADYMLGGGVSSFGFNGGLGAGPWQSGIKITADFPANMMGTAVTDFTMYKVNNGIRVEGIGSTTTYGNFVSRGTIMKIAAGGVGLYCNQGAYDNYIDIEIYEDDTTAGALCVDIGTEFNVTMTNVRCQGPMRIDAPFGVLSNVGVEGGFDFSALSNTAISIGRIGSATGLFLNNVGNAAITTLVRTSAVVATCTTNRPHGLTTGDVVVMTDCIPTQFRGSVAVTVTGATTFTYTLAADPGINATTVGYFAATTGAMAITGLQIAGAEVNVDGVTFVGDQPGFPYYPLVGSSGTVCNISCSTPLTDPVVYCTAATWQALRISDSPQLTAYGWETRTVSALPTAIDQARGIQRLLLGGGGVADRAVVCRKDAAGSFAWVDLF